MGVKLTWAAILAAQAAPPVGKRRDQAAAGSLSTPERMALTLLAHAAQDNSPLAWWSLPKLAEVVGCSLNTIGPAVATLATAGHVTIMPGRTGLKPFYLVHPGGGSVGSVPELKLADVSAHLENPRAGLSRADRAAALDWLTQLGLLGGAARSAAIVRATTRTLRASRTTPPTIGGVGIAEIGQDTPNHCGHPPQPLEPSPPTIGGEPIIEPEKEPVARGMAAPMTEGPPPTDPQQEAIQRMAAGTAAPGTPTKANQWRTKWMGPASEVLARLRAAGGPDAARLGSMSDTEALEAVQRQQRLLRVQNGVADIAA